LSQGPYFLAHASDATSISLAHRAGSHRPGCACTCRDRGFGADCFACGSPSLPPVCTPLASLFIPMNHIGFNTEPFSIPADRFASSWSSFRTDAYAGKAADCDRRQVHFRLGMWLAGSGYWVSSYLGFSDAMV